MGDVLADTGSVAASGQGGVTQLVFAKSPAEKTRLMQRSKALEQRFRELPIVALEPELLDLRRVHIALYNGLCPKLPVAIGAYRGTLGTALETARRIVHVPLATGDTNKIDICFEPEDVLDGMEVLNAEIATFLSTGPRKDNLQELARLTHSFLRIHPFLDGNGHIWRLALIGLGRIAGMGVSDAWTVQERPHGAAFSRAVQRYGVEPTLLERQLAAYFD